MLKLGDEVGVAKGEDPWKYSGWESCPYVSNKSDRSGSGGAGNNVSGIFLSRELPGKPLNC